MSGKTSTITLLQWRAGAMILLVSFIHHGSAAIIDCSPESQSVIKCEYSTTTEDCPSADFTQSGTPITTVNDLTTERFFNNKNNFTGVKISWSSPSSYTLNSTGAFNLSLYYYNSSEDQVLILCRHFIITYLESTVRPHEESFKFVYVESALPYYNKQVTAELITLPADDSLYVPSVSISDFYTYGNPVERFNYDMTKDKDSDPYTVTVQLRLPSFTPDLQVLYNHSYYEIIILDFSYKYVKNFSNDEVPIFKVETKDLTSEYTNVTFSALRPSNYLIYIWPYRKSAVCITYCPIVSDSHQAETRSVKVVGYDYIPDKRPQVFLTANKKLTVSFQVAPSKLYITRYNVILYIPSHAPTITQTVLSNQSTDWYTYSNTFNAVDVVDTFLLIDNNIRVKVVPVMHTSICTNPGMCNLNGTCTPCTESISLPLVLPDTKTATDGTSNVTSGAQQEVSKTAAAVSSAVVVSLMVLGLVLIVIYLRKKSYAKVNEQLKEDRITVYTSITGNDGADCMFMGGPVKTCVAFAAGPGTQEHCMQLYHTLRKIFAEFFNCPFSLYSDICQRGSAKLSSHKAVLILCTPELYKIHQKLKSSNNPDVMRVDQMNHCRVRELLMAPQLPHTPARILVAFDHTPDHYINELTSNNGGRRVDVYILPRDLEQLVSVLYCGASDANISSWPDWLSKGSSLEKKLQRIITELAEINNEALESKDSGYAKTVTVNTQPPMDISQPIQKLKIPHHQHPQSEQQLRGMQQLTTSPHANIDKPEQRANGEKCTTLAEPQALEMVYLRQYSSEIPEHLRHRVSVELVSVSSDSNEPTTTPTGAASFRYRSSSGERNSLIHDTGDTPSVYTVTTENQPATLLSSRGEIVVDRVEV